VLEQINSDQISPENLYVLLIKRQLTPTKTSIFPT